MRRTDLGNRAQKKINTLECGTRNSAFQDYHFEGKVIVKNALKEHMSKKERVRRRKGILA